jgi:hypothetical protein
MHRHFLVTGTVPLAENPNALWHLFVRIILVLYMAAAAALLTDFHSY